MNKKEYPKMNRREALKQMGTVAIGAGLGIGGLHAAEVLGNPTGEYQDRKMKVLLVNGSPNKEGCTYTALTEVGKGLKEQNVDSEVFWIGRRPISGCVACGACSKTGRCYMNDAVNEFLDKAEGYDGFVFGSPVHFAAMAGNITSFMDRAFFCARTNNEMAGKPAASVTSCRRSGSTSTLDQLNRYFIHRGMPVVPSQYWPMVYGNTPEEVRQDGEGLQIMRTLGRNMAWLMHSIEAGKQMGLVYPECEKRIQTNFIR